MPLPLSSRVFLRAEWRQLAILNYVVDPQLLRAMLPKGTELDLWRGRAYMSVVGFLFLRARIHGVAVPFHGSFEEVNLRFYVRRRAKDGWRRGVVFVRELAPRRMVAWVANLVYHENYRRVPMGHRVTMDDREFVGAVAYTWSCRGRRGGLDMTLPEAPSAVASGSEQEFIAEHYWGYSAQRDGGTLEYRVRHPAWAVCAADRATLDCDVATVFGERFVELFQGGPTSAFFADGSAVEVCRGTRLST